MIILYDNSYPNRTASRQEITPCAGNWRHTLWSDAYEECIGLF